jgi:signal transduction histidine kinase
MLARLEDAFMRLRRFTGDVSHELRTPLAVLLGESELALRKERSTGDYRVALQAITLEAKHMQAIVEDLLLLARAESRAVAMSWQMLSTEGFIHDLSQMVKADYEKRRVILTIKMDLAELNFAGNAGFLYIALKNILLNAAKHSVAGAQVKFDVSSKCKQTIFVVSDEGEGIPSESLPYIFDPFYRADTARNRSLGGSGIGLSLASAMIKLHDGSIQVESTLGKGTTFIVTLPGAPESKTKESQQAHRSRMLSLTKKLNAPKPADSINPGILSEQT